MVQKISRLTTSFGVFPCSCFSFECMGRTLIHLVSIRCTTTCNVNSVGIPANIPAKYIWARVRRRRLLRRRRKNLLKRKNLGRVEYFTTPHPHPFHHTTSPIPFFTTPHPLHLILISIPIPILIPLIKASTPSSHLHH